MNLMFFLNKKTLCKKIVMKRQILPEMILYPVVVIFLVFLSKSIDYFFVCLFSS